MSDDFMESIWAQFAVETDEHLEAMEQILVEAERNAVSAEEIARLFRSFHSVKGLCKALDLLAMEKLSHRAEDLLGLVRDGTISLDLPTVGLLLEAVDELKLLHVKAVAERADGVAPEGLILRLGAAFAEGKGEAPAAAVEVAPVAAAEIAPVAQADIALPEPEKASQSLHEDPEMMEFFMDLVRENLPSLTVLMRPECELPSNCNGCNLCEQMLDGIESIARASEAMGFTQIKEVLDEIRSYIPEEGGPVSQAQREQIIARLPRFQELISFIESESGKDAGGGQLASYLAASMRANFDHLFETLFRDLDALSENHASDDVIADEVLADALYRNLAAAHSYFSFLAPETNTDLLLLLEDVYGRASHCELSISGEIVGVTREVLILLRQIYFNKVEGGVGESPGMAVQRDELSHRIRDYIWGYESSGKGNNPVEVFRDFIKDLKINPELAEILSPENVRDLMEAVKEGSHMYEVLAHLESSEEVAAGFLTWVAKSGKVITNRSVFIEGNSWYEMLVVSKLGHEEVDAAFRVIDPTEKLIELKTSSGKVELPAAPPIRATKPVANNAAAANASAATAGSNVIRVAGETLDSFMNQIGEMVLVRAQLNFAINNEASQEALVSLKLLLNEHYTGRREADNRMFDVVEAFEAQARKLAEVDALIQSALLRLQESAMALRVVPMETVFKRFPRLVRDLAQSQGKRIRLDQAGQEVKIDKAMVEVLSDPLMHMVRNSADHGIEMPEERRAAGKPEEAQILINALQQGSRVIVQVSDDGRGIDTEKVRRKAVERGLVKEAESLHLSQEEIFNFLFLPGFSTAEKITETSGRGVGMDVVRSNVMRLGGKINIKSELGKGSVFTLEMPLSAAVQEVMLVRVAGQTLALPGRYVTEVVQIESAEIQSVKGRQAVLLRGAFLPLVYMGDLLGFERKAGAKARYRAAVVVSNGQQMVGVEVDRMIGRRELFVKDIHPRLAALPGVGGASIMGDGKVVLILDGEALLRLAQSAEPRPVVSNDALEAA
jgi:two-component system, chemotaxis family, sensor kinase CheA